MISVIEILNIIANDENPPEMIEFEGVEYKYDYKDRNYYQLGYDRLPLFYKKSFKILNKKVNIIENEEE